MRFKTLPVSPGAFIAVLLLSWIVSHYAAFGQPTTAATAVAESLYSPSLGRMKPLTVLLPPAYDTTQRYPVVYLLHGLRGTHRDWLEHTSLRQQAESYPFIFVLPDAEDSWCVNSFTEPLERFEDYLIHDIPAYVLQKYRIDTTRQAIAGMSMGGVGAIALALKHPRQFLFAGGISSAFDVPRDIELREKNRVLPRNIPSMKRAFGNAPNSYRSLHDVFELYRKIDRDSMPYLYFVNGIQDEYRFRLAVHREFADSLRAYYAPYEYHETPGRHTMRYAEKELPPLLRRLHEVMRFGFRSAADILNLQISRKGLEPALKRFREIRTLQPRGYYIDESELTTLGLRLLDYGKSDEAIEVLKLSVETYPQSARCYESLAEAYQRAGEIAPAIENYEHALFLDPLSEFAIERLKELRGE